MIVHFQGNLRGSCDSLEITKDFQGSFHGSSDSLESLQGRFIILETV